MVEKIVSVYFLSIKAAASGANLKNYIETLLEKDVEDMDETATYQYLCWSV